MPRPSITDGTAEIVPTRLRCQLKDQQTSGNKRATDKSLSMKTTASGAVGCAFEPRRAHGMDGHGFASLSAKCGATNVFDPAAVSDHRYNGREVEGHPHSGPP